MSAETDDVPDGQVYVREDLLYADETRVHLSDDCEYAIAEADAALLELVFRGDSSFPRLCGRIAALTGKPASSVASDLAPLLRDPRSILDLRDAIGIEPPGVIVCDFSHRGRLGANARMVERLRRSHQVLHLGIGRHVRGPWPRNATLTASQKAGAHSNWYEFAQWCRGVIARHPEALLVLCGQQDAILFGDLVPRMRTVALLDPAWPTVVGASDMLGADWIPDDPYPLVRDLYYALRFAPLDEIEALNRTTGSSFARLEGYALRHATAVAYALTDQPAALAQLGRDCDPDRLVHGERVRSPRVLHAGSRRALVLVAGIERGIEPLGPFLHFVRAAVEAGRVGGVFIAAADAWFEVRFQDDVVHVHDTGGRRLGPADCLAAVLFPGLIRDCRPAFELLAQGIPAAAMPSRRPHPLQDRLPESSILRGLDATRFVAWLDRLTAPDDPLSGELVRAQQGLLRRCDVVRLIGEHAPRAAAVPASSPVIARAEIAR